MKSEKNLETFLYKLLVDALALLLLLFLLFIIAESILPEVISAHFSFLKFSFIIFATLITASYFGGKSGVSFEYQPKRKNLSWLWISVFIFIILNSSLEFSLLEISIISFSSIFILIYLKKMVLENEN